MDIDKLAKKIGSSLSADYDGETNQLLDNIYDVLQSFYESMGIQSELYREASIGGSNYTKYINIKDTGLEYEQVGSKINIYKVKQFNSGNREKIGEIIKVNNNFVLNDEQFNLDIINQHLYDVFSKLVD